MCVCTRLSGVSEPPPPPRCVSTRGPWRGVLEFTENVGIFWIPPKEKVKVEFFGFPHFWQGPALPAGEDLGGRMVCERGEEEGGPRPGGRRLSRRARRAREQGSQARLTRALGWGRQAV